LSRLQNRLGIGRREQIILSVLASAALIAGILLIFQPQADAPPTTRFESYEQHSGAINVNFTGSYEVPLQRVRTHAVEEYLTPTQLLQSFVQSLGMQRAEYSLTGNTYITPAGDATITFGGGDQGMLYSQSKALRPSLSVVSQDAARAVAGDFLNNLGYTQSELTLLDDQITYFAFESGNNDSLEETNSDQAIIIRLPYEKRLDSLPVTYGASAIEKIDVDITTEGVFRAVLPNTFFSTVPGNQFSVISVETALENMRSGQFSIIGTTERVIEEEQFVELNLTEQSLQYRFDTAAKLLFPVFRFEGTAKTITDEVTPIIVVTEAIAVQDLSTPGTVESAPQNTPVPHP